MPIDVPWTTISGSDVWAGTLGNGAATIRFRRTAGTIQFIAQLFVGSTTVFDGAPNRFLLPPGSAVPDALSPSQQPFESLSGFGDNPVVGVASGGAVATSSLVYPLVALVYQGSTVEGLATAVDLYVDLYATTGARLASTVPFTFQAGDLIVVGNALEAFDN